jgi:hypothetical protein
VFGPFHAHVCRRQNDLPHCYTDTLRPVASDAVGGDRLHFGYGETFEVRVYDSGGVLERIVRWTGQTLELTSERVDAYRSARLAEAGDDSRAQVERELSTMTFPERLPAFVSMIVDREGSLWVQEAVDLRALGSSGGAFASPPIESPPIWSVFDRRGVFLGRITFPEHLWVTDITTKHVVGVAVDELGVPTVRVYAINKPATASRDAS